MDKEKLLELLFLGESNNIELKNEFDDFDICESICSFLNSEGGFVVCGVNNYFELEQVEHWKQKIEERIENSIHPHAPVFVSISSIDNKQILIIEVPEGHDKPYEFAQKVYIRRNNSPYPADIGIIKEMIFSSQVAPIRWERRFADEISIDDLSSDELQRLLGKMPFCDDFTLQRNLEKLSLFRQGRLTNAADILLTNDSAIRHPQSRVRAVCYTQKTASKYHDIKKFEGPVIQLVEDILNFIERNTASQAVFLENSAQRMMIPQYPTNAIREGLVNAFAHRDYASYGGGIRVEISPEKLTIWNSGSLPEGVSLTSLQKGQLSVLRNPDIANYLHLHGYMEMLGRGSVLIQKECKKANLPAPQWQADEAGVTLTFFASNSVCDDLGPMTGPMTGPMMGPMMGPKLSDDYLAELESTSKMDVVMKILTKEPMSQSEIAAALGLNSVSGALKRAVEALEKKFHFIEKIVPDKTTSKKQKYRLTNLGKKFLENNYK